VLTGKKSIKFTIFYGLQDPRMHVRKFQEEAMEYMHDKDLLAKLFSHNLKDDGLKWYFLLPKKSIDKYEDLIHQFCNTLNIILLKRFTLNICIKLSNCLINLCLIL